MENKTSILIQDIKNDPRFDQAKLSSVSIKSSIGVPLTVEGSLIGSLIVFNKNKNIEFDSEELHYLEKLAVIAAPFLRNVQHIQQYFESPLPDSALIGKYEKLGLLGKSKRYINLLKSIEAAARCDVRVLLEGKSGTGKELLSRAIHINSSRSDKPFIAVDCGAIQQNLMESEFFGHKRGAFTGAISDRIGLMEEVNGGTLFMDEISNLSFEMQSKLLRVLQEGEIRPVGSNKSRKVDVRIISAASSSLKGMVEKKLFREDLFFRLYVYPIQVPSLSERREDIPLLANYFLKKFSSEQNKKIGSFNKEIMDYLTGYSWTGNIRELENQIERLVTYAPAEAEVLDLLMLPLEFRKEIRGTILYQQPLNSIEPLQENLENYEAKLIERALETCQWNQSRAARALKISEASIRFKMKRYGLKPSNKK
jgi:transcriptional regulator with GAF, ATPase, and Fis domain